MKKQFSKIIATATTMAFMLGSHPLMAQVVTLSPGEKTNSTLNMFLGILTGASVILVSGAAFLLGYRAMYEPNFKLADGKNLLIGGVIIGSAGAIANYFKV